MLKEISRSLRKKINAIRSDVTRVRFKTSSKLGEKERKEGLKKLEKGVEDLDDILIYPCSYLTSEQKKEYLLLAKKMSQLKEKQNVPITLSLDTSFNNGPLMKNNKQEDSSIDTESLSTMSDLSLETSETSQKDTAIETPTRNNLSLFGASFGNLHQQFNRSFALS